MLFASLALLFSTTSIYDFKVKTIDGAEKSLADYKGKVLLIVNVASECGYTPQYADLQKLYEKYRSQGFAVLGFPCNDFGGQEPGSEKDIKAFCVSRFGVTFDMFSKITMSHPLYQYLTANAKPSGKVDWNFEKFLIDRNGNIVGRFKSGVKPMSETLTKAIEEALAKK
ncbi:MAG: glutathione peroxidase [Chloroherpetonaceae bacterium]|nr:glutathione peroxidase [Chloroherpetonaceae bacterium]MDW8437024.1 glutathione peroxidase [Chloroherpetonaceae bacterium]